MMAEFTPRGLNSLPQVRAGFIPLSDCAPLIIASELSLDRKYGFEFRLHREVSWANIRDKIDIGALDCAHMLAPMPMAAALGLGRATAPLIAPMALSLNGNAITVSTAVFNEMCAADFEAARGGGMRVASAIAKVVQKRQTKGAAPLTFGMVFPFSSHNYDLRYWLAAAGIDPDNDVNLIVTPPPLLADSLKAGRIDGFCVGSPWNSVSVDENAGVIVATKSEIWAASPEKVLGMTEEWASHNPGIVVAIVQAVTEAARWLDEPDNRIIASRILARPEYIGVREQTLLSGMTGLLDVGGERPSITVPDMMVFHRHYANFPWRSHAVWLMTQMIRWGQAREPFNLRDIAERAFRPDIYRDAVKPLGIGVPDMDYKPEAGAAFFGGDAFDPHQPLSYLNGLPIRSAAVDLPAFAVQNA